MGIHRPQVPALSIEMVMEEFKGLPRFENRQSARAFLVLQRQRNRMFISTDMEDAEQQVENLMGDRWIPLGFVAYFADSSKAVTRCLTWYGDLLKKHEKRYKELVDAVTTGLKTAASELNEQLIKEGVIQRLQ
jgi:hypothetical protein